MHRRLTKNKEDLQSCTVFASYFGQRRKWTARRNERKVRLAVGSPGPARDQHLWLEHSESNALWTLSLELQNFLQHLLPMSLLLSPWSFSGGVSVEQTGFLSEQVARKKKTASKLREYFSCQNYLSRFCKNPWLGAILRWPSSLSLSKSGSQKRTCVQVIRTNFR